MSAGDVTHTRGAIALALFALCGVAADLHAQLRTRVQASGFESPLAFVQDPVDRAVQFVVQQNGRIRVLRESVFLSPSDTATTSAPIISLGRKCCRTSGEWVFTMIWVRVSLSVSGGMVKSVHEVRNRLINPGNLAS